MLSRRWPRRRGRRPEREPRVDARGEARGSRRGRAEKSEGRWRGRLGPPGGGDGPVRAVGAGVHPGLVRALGGRAVQRGGGEAHPQEQPELRRAGETLLPPHLGRSVPGAERGARLVYTGRGRRRRRSLPPRGRGGGRDPARPLPERRRETRPPFLGPSRRPLAWSGVNPEL